MTHERDDSPTPDADADLLRLVNELHAGTITDAAMADLTRRLTDDADVRARYFEIVRNESAMFALHAAPLDPSAHRPASIDRRRAHLVHHPRPARGQPRPLDRPARPKPHD